MGSAWAEFERLRWDGPPPSCVRCGVAGRSSLLPVDADDARRVWRCGACRSQFSVLSATLLEGSRLPLSTWVALVRDVSTGQVLSARGLARRHEITAETARTVLAMLAHVTPLGTGRDALLRGLLRLGRDDVARVRAVVPRRRGRTVGPVADYR